MHLKKFWSRVKHFNRKVEDHRTNKIEGQYNNSVYNWGNFREFKTNTFRIRKHKRKLKIHRISFRNTSIFLIYIQNRDKEWDKFIKKNFLI